MSDDQVLRRHFIAIATDAYEASGTFAKLDVGKEVAAMRRWLADEALGERRFDDQGYAALADRPSFNQIRQMLLEHRRFTHADAVVVYVTGHGITGPDKSHLIVLHGTDPQAPSEALRTADLITWLAGHRDLDQVMIIVDVCQAGQLDNNLPAELKRDLPAGWLVVVTAPAGVDAKLGAFTGAVEPLIDELRSSTDATSRSERYLLWHQFLEPVVRRLRDSNHEEPMVIKFPWQPPSVYLPNPGFDPSWLDRVVTNRARRDLAILSQDMTAHWAVRAPVVADGRPVFTGRARLMRELIAFTEGPAATLVVTGRAWLRQVCRACPARDLQRSSVPRRARRRPGRGGARPPAGRGRCRDPRDGQDIGADRPAARPRPGDRWTRVMGEDGTRGLG